MPLRAADRRVYAAPREQSPEPGRARVRQQDVPPTAVFRATRGIPKVTGRFQPPLRNDGGRDADAGRKVELYYEVWNPRGATAPVPAA